MACIGLRPISLLGSFWKVAGVFLAFGIFGHFSIESRVEQLSFSTALQENLEDLAIGRRIRGLTS